MLFNGRVCLSWCTLALLPTWPNLWLANNRHLFTVSMQQRFLWWLQAVFGPNPTLLTAALSLLMSPGFFPQPGHQAPSATSCHAKAVCDPELQSQLPALTLCPAVAPRTAGLSTAGTQPYISIGVGSPVAHANVPCLGLLDLPQPPLRTCTSCHVPSPSRSTSVLTPFLQPHQRLLCFSALLLSP